MLREVVRNRIQRYEWTKNDATEAAADFILEASLDTARHLTTVLCHPSHPQPMLSIDNVARDATRHDELAELYRSVTAFLKRR